MAREDDTLPTGVRRGRHDEDIAGYSAEPAAGGGVRAAGGVGDIGPRHCGQVFPCPYCRVQRFALGVLAILLFLTGLTLVATAVISRSRQLPHGALSRTRNVSTLPVPEDMLDRVGGQIPYYPPEELPPERRGPMLNG